MSLLYYGDRKQCELGVTILKGSFIQDIAVEDDRSHHPGDLEDLDVRLHKLGKRSRDTGTGSRETGDG